MSQNPAAVTKRALIHAAHGEPVFPAKPWPDKGPLTNHGFYDASTDPAVIEAWWRRWPHALIAIATGAAGIAVLDVDAKDPRRFGPDSLELLGHAVPDTWIAHTPSGGWHHWFDAAGRDVPSTTGKLGPGLDVRAQGGYIIAPTPGSAYRWDPHRNPETLPLAPVPDWLIPPPPKPVVHAKPVRPCIGLSPYADAAIERACTAIRDAPHGQQHQTLARECFSIGTLAGAGGIPEDFARLALIDAGLGMPSYNPRDKWIQKTVERTVRECFAAGLARPRSTIGEQRAD